MDTSIHVKYLALVKAGCTGQIYGVYMCLNWNLANCVIFSLRRSFRIIRDFLAVTKIYLLQVQTFHQVSCTITDNNLW